MKRQSLLGWILLIALLTVTYFSWVTIGQSGSVLLSQRFGLVSAGALGVVAVITFPISLTVLTALQRWFAFQLSLEDHPVSFSKALGQNLFSLIPVGIGGIMAVIIANLYPESLLTGTAVYVLAQSGWIIYGLIASIHYRKLYYFNYVQFLLFLLVNLAIQYFSNFHFIIAP